jgi:hypothetical protein
VWEILKNSKKGSERVEAKTKSTKEGRISSRECYCTRCFIYFWKQSVLLLLVSIFRSLKDVACFLKHHSEKMNTVFTKLLPRNSTLRQRSGVVKPHRTQFSWTIPGSEEPAAPVMALILGGVAVSGLMLVSALPRPFTAGTRSLRDELNEVWPWQELYKALLPISKSQSKGKHG